MANLISAPIPNKASPGRHAFVHRGLLLLLVLLTVTLMLGFLILKMHTGKGIPADISLKLYCAAGIKKPVEAAVRDYGEAYGIPIEIQYGGSGTLLGNIEVARTGDLYLAGDESYILLAREKGLVAESIPLARFTPVIAVQKDNPKGIAGLKDLLREDVAVALGNPEAAAIGRITHKVLMRTGLWKDLEKNVKVFKPTVNDLALDVSMGAVDAAVIWDAIADQYEEVDYVADEAFSAATQRVTIGVLKSSDTPAQALRFARFLSARDKGLPLFETFGFKPVDGDVWEEEPTILLYSGAMLRPGVEETLKAFEKREGVTINRVYNGCGILVAQMRSGAEPEAYLSCDLKFMDMVQDRFDPPTVLAENDIVMAVHKGNPKGIGCLEDLAREGLRVGLAHPEKSALGYLTKLLLEGQGLFEAIQKNAVLESATGDFLINQLRTGGLDAIVVYVSNVKSTPENAEKYMDILAVDLPGAKAMQPWAIARDSRHRHLLKRLFEALTSKETQRRFESVGFRWRLEKKEGEASEAP
jgi:molybdenum ABC transporter molybdate-binding protein